MNKMYFVFIGVTAVSIIAIWQIVSILDNTVFYTPQKSLGNEVQAIESKYQLDCNHIMSGVQLCGQLQPMLNDIDSRLTKLENKT